MPHPTDPAPAPMSPAVAEPDAQGVSARDLRGTGLGRDAAFSQDANESRASPFPRPDRKPLADPSADIPGAVPLDTHGQRLWLLPDRTLWWPAARTLFVADAHFGKGATFRARGLPVPGGTTADNLARLSHALAQRRAAHLVFLGDFLHAREAHAPALLRALHAWRATHAAVAMTLVRGNHDSHAGDPPPSLGIGVVDEPLRVGPFAACHHPDADAGPNTTVLAGHWHPVVRLHGPAGDSVRLPCFVQRGSALILPSFGAFTGGHAVVPARGTRCYAVGGGRVWALPDAC